MDKEFAVSALDWRKWIKSPYVVELVGWPGLSNSDRATAEIRFVAELERALGGPHAVERACWELHKAEELVEAIGPNAPFPNSPWAAAVTRARAAGFAGLQPPSSATFWFSLYDDVHELPDGIHDPH